MLRSLPHALVLGSCCLGCAPQHTEAPTCPEAPIGTASNNSADLAPSFLPLLEDHALRDEFWAFYLEVEPLAKRFASPARPWVPVRMVIASDRALWWAHGLIEIPAAADDIGVVAHELFHGAFHRSALNAGRDAAWGEGFADAFRYLVEREVLGDRVSPWRREMDELAALPPEQRLAACSSNDVDRVYRCPALSILERAQWDLERLEALWFELNARRQAEGREVLSAEFGSS